MRKSNLPHKPTDLIKHGWWSISPLIIFLCVYLVTSLCIGDFYKIPITSAFLLSSFWAFLTLKGKTTDERIYLFLDGFANRNILLMVWIFILSGAFAQSAKAMGAIDATVLLTLQIVPDNLLYAGVFLATCFISLSIGTSVGTIVALTPVAAGIAQEAQLLLPHMIAIVVGGAFFGDNLSFISDTTIVATQTQGCAMRDKFRVNSLIVVPAALIILFIYIGQGFDVYTAIEQKEIEWIKITPYLLVLLTALSGVNVVYVLLLGIGATGIIGIATCSFDYFNWLQELGNGIAGMGELIIVTLLAGGLLEIVRVNGGLDFLISALVSRVRSKRGGELAIAVLVSLAGFCTANNTIAIITVGPIAKSIATKMGIDSRKSASILDSFSCFIQGIIPYGAQLLMASGLAKISPVSIIGHLYYPFLMGATALIAILCRYPRRYS